MDELETSAADVLALVERESAAIGADNILLDGISQGCAAAIFALLEGRRRLGGFIGLSSWIPVRHMLETMCPANEALIDTEFHSTLSR